jgi:HSP90 family molecular chaperone
LEEKKLKDLIQKHSEFAGCQINHSDEKTKEEEVSNDEDEYKDKKDDEEKLKKRKKNYSGWT